MNTLINGKANKHQKGSSTITFMTMFAGVLIYGANAYNAKILADLKDPMHKVLEKQIDAKIAAANLEALLSHSENLEENTKIASVNQEKDNQEPTRGQDQKDGQTQVGVQDNSLNKIKIAFSEKDKSKMHTIDLNKLGLNKFGKFCRLGTDKCDMKIKIELTPSTKKDKKHTFKITLINKKGTLQLKDHTQVIDL